MSAAQPIFTQIYPHCYGKPHSDCSAALVDSQTYTQVRFTVDSIPQVTVVLELKGCQKVPYMAQRQATRNSWF